MTQNSDHRRKNGKLGGRPRSERPLSDRMQLRLYADQRERLEALGVNVNEWIREAVDERLGRLTASGSDS